jgi:hypothetical protein
MLKERISFRFFGLGLCLIVPSLLALRYVAPFYPGSWISVQGSQPVKLLTSKQRIQIILDSIPNNPLNPVKVLELTTAAGTKSSVYLFIGEFRSSTDSTAVSLEPAESWKEGILAKVPQKTPRFLVVNSVGEYEAPTENPNAISHFLYPGCFAGQRTNTTLINPGDISVYECKGSLHSQGFSWLSNHGIFVCPARGTRPCPEKNLCASDTADVGTAEDSDGHATSNARVGTFSKNETITSSNKIDTAARDECRAGVASASLLRLFAFLREQDSVRPDGLYLIALGTGYDRLPPNAWYDALSKQIFVGISNKEYSARFPAVIVLPVSYKRIGDASQRTDEKEAMAGSLGNLVRDWTVADHTPPKSVEALTGVLAAFLSMGILILVFSFRLIPVTLAPEKWTKGLPQNNIYYIECFMRAWLYECDQRQGRYRRVPEGLGDSQRGATALVGGA